MLAGPIPAANHAPAAPGTSSDRRQRSAQKRFPTRAISTSKKPGAKAGLEA